jgi:hypothetical protein
LRIHHAFIYPDLRFAQTGSGALPGSVYAASRHIEEGAAVQSRQRYLILGIAMTLTPVAVTVASPASADCSGAGAATVCAQGTVRGGGPDAPIAGPAYPGYCADPWYCDDDWGIDIDLNPPRPPGGGGIFPGRPGGGGGIGPR